MIKSEDLFKAHILDDFYPKEVVQNIAKYINDIIYERKGMAGKHMFNTNMFDWDKRLSGLKNGKIPLETPYLVLIHIISNHDKEFSDYVTEETNKLVRPYGYKIVYSPMYHLWTPQSRINWHCDYAPKNDELRHGALTVYLNGEWGLDRGGELLYTTHSSLKEGIEKVTPAYNRAVLLDGGVHHKTTPVVEGNLRKSLQIWLTKL